MRQWQLRLAFPLLVLYVLQGIQEPVSQSGEAMQFLPQLPVSSTFGSLLLIRLLLTPVLFFELWRRPLRWFAWLGLGLAGAALLSLGLTFLEPLLQTPNGFGFFALAALAWSMMTMSALALLALLLLTFAGRLYRFGLISRDPVARKRTGRLLGGAAAGGAVLIAIAYGTRPDVNPVLLDSLLNEALEQGTTSAETRHVLFVGNSLTHAYQLPQRMALAWSTLTLVPPLKAVGLTRNGYTLVQHHNEGLWEAALPSHRFSQLVLQEQSAFVLDSADRTVQELQRAKVAAEKEGVQPYLLSMPAPRYYLIKIPPFNHAWAPRLRAWGQPLDTISTWGEVRLEREPDSPEQAPLDPRLWGEAYRLLSSKSGIPLIPVSRVAEVCAQRLPEVELLVEDGIHPSDLGTQAAALTFMALLQSPEARPALFQKALTVGKAAALPSLPESVIGIVQEVLNEPSPPQLSVEELRDADSVWMYALLQDHLGSQAAAIEAYNRFLTMARAIEPIERADIEARLARLKSTIP